MTISSTSPESTEPCPVTPSQFKKIVKAFFQDLSFRLPELPSDPSLEQHVVKKCCGEARAQGIDVQAVSDFCSRSVELTLLVYPLHDKEVQKLIATHTAYMFIVDDLGSLFVDQLEDFRRNIILGRPQESPILEGWAKLLAEFDQYYGPFCASGILSSALDFVATEPLEIATKGNLRVHPSARKFAYYFRQKSSMLETYTNFILVQSIFPENVHLSQFIQAVPDLMDYCGYVNDVLSFYKESMIQTERNNYVYNYAAANGKSISEALENLISETAECVRNVRSILQSEPQLLSCVETYFEGLLALHVYLPRYMLSELNMVELLSS